MKTFAYISIISIVLLILAGCGKTELTQPSEQQSNFQSLPSVTCTLQPTLTDTPTSTSTPVPPTPTSTNTPTPTPTLPYQISFESSRCNFFYADDSQKMECGYLIVPEDRAHSTSRMVKLPVVIFKSTSSDPAPDPLIYLAGGGGGNILKYANYYRTFAP